MQARIDNPKRLETLGMQVIERRQNKKTPPPPKKNKKKKQKKKQLNWGQKRGATRNPPKTGGEIGCL